jgi:hypothetical protein
MCMCLRFILLNSLFDCQVMLAGEALTPSFSHAAIARDEVGKYSSFPRPRPGMVIARSMSRRKIRIPLDDDDDDNGDGDLPS